MLHVGKLQCIRQQSLMRSLKNGRSEQNTNEFPIMLILGLYLNAEPVKPLQQCDTKAVYGHTNYLTPFVPFHYMQRNITSNFLC